MWPATGDPADDEDALPDIASLTIEPDHTPADVLEESRRLLGIGMPRHRLRGPGPDISWLREKLGI